MTQARANKAVKATTKKAKQPRAAAIKTTRAATKAEPEIDGERFEVLWLRFEDEAGLTSERLEKDREKLEEEIAGLQAKIDEKRATLAAVEGRVDAAKQQMRALLAARLSDDAILSAMRVEYKVKKSGGGKKKELPALPPAADEEKQFVLDHLDAEGLSVAELKKLTGKDARLLRSALEALAAEGKIIKSGERASAKYHLS